MAEALVVSFFVLLLIILALVLYYRRLVALREKALTALQNNFIDLRKLKKKILSIKKGYEAYALFEFEPYGELVNLLCEKISSLGDNYVAVWQLQRKRTL